MEPKKSKKANLEKNRFLFLEIGFVVTLLTVLLAFNWSTYENNDNTLGELLNFNEVEEIIPITRQEQEKPKILPHQIKVFEVINIVKNTEKIIHELTVESTEATQKTRIQEVTMDQEPEVADDIIFYTSEEEAVFPGGFKELRKYIASNIEYPKIAKENGIKGKVFIQFVVNKKGYVEQVKVVRSVDPSLDNEAIRIIKNLPRWMPGKQQHRPVNVLFTVPINFQLK
ncbi:MAG: energy transducer TonB [Bacteroidetes bacterium]|nr:energy transducer TonB [Bacteroidota bacterium]